MDWRNELISSGADAKEVFHRLVDSLSEVINLQWRCNPKGDSFEAFADARVEGEDFDKNILNLHLAKDELGDLCLHNAYVHPKLRDRSLGSRLVKMAIARGA